MASNQQPDLNSLIAKCECAIRRGDVSHLETLHMFQQRLVAARDARQQSQRDRELQAAVKLYYDLVPADVRTTTFADLTEQVERASAQLNTGQIDSASESVP